MTPTRMTRTAASLLALALAAFVVACGGADDGFASGADDELNDNLGDVQKPAAWGSATTCKAIPAPIANLRDPVIDISIDGLTLHLYDRQGTFDKVYPIGPGMAKDGKSLTPVGHFSTGPADAVGAKDNGNVVGASPWAWWYQCKMWWMDREDPAKKWQPVYAGLPLIRLKGAPTLGYAIHGPIDAYNIPSGGLLRRGLVSHGCIRMAAADILEVFAMLRGKANVPINIQRAVDRDADGRAIDLASKWVGSECDQDVDCDFTGGSCRANAYGHKFCTMACSGSCADKATEIVTACVSDGQGQGMCVRQSSLLNNSCRGYEGFEQGKGIPRFGSSRIVNACIPGSFGFVGDSCLSSADCASGRTCERAGMGPGFCTQACTTNAQCPTANGLASACSAKRCLRTCDVQDACGVSTGTTCKKVGTVTACNP